MAHYHLLIAVLVGVFTWTDVAGTLCSEQERILNLDDDYSIATSGYSNAWSTEKHCVCTARLDDPYDHVFISQQLWFQIDETDVNNGELSNDTCGAAIRMDYGNSKLFSCPADNTNATSHMIELQGTDVMTWNLLNPREGRVKVRLDLKATSGSANLRLAVTCSRGSLGSYSTCACGAAREVIIYSLRTDEDFDKRVIIAIVCVLVFLCLIVVVALIYCCKNRNKDEKYIKDECPPMGDGSENQAYTKSRSNLALNSPPPNSGPGGPPNYAGFADLGQMAFMGDPGMDLSLQTPYKNQMRGSTDSGLYSMPDASRQNGAPGGPPHHDGPPQHDGPPHHDGPAAHETPLDPHSLYAQPHRYRPNNQHSPAMMPGRPPNRVYKTPSQGSLHDNPAFNAHDTSKGSINTLGSVETDV